MERIIQNSISKYLKYGPRSNKKLEQLHSYIASSITKNLPDCQSCSLPGKEINVQGKFYCKKVDVHIKNIDNVGIVSVKFVMSNFCQNSNNYFENLVGEMYNLKDVGPRLFVMVIFDDIPYYDNKRNIIRYEKIKNLDRYDSLLSDGILSDYVVIKISGGKSLSHPSKIEKNFDCSRFKIVDEYPQSYEKCIKQFSEKLKIKKTI
jgi:hypothetical protein